MQPMLDYQPITRRPLDVEDYIDSVRRQKGWVFGPAFAALVIAVVVAFFWPDTYISTATIRVVPSMVPENLVPGQVNIQLSRRINDMAQQVLLNRSVLREVVLGEDLYPDDRKNLPVEDVAEAMLKDIRIGAVQAIDTQAGAAPMGAFEISYAYTDRRKAQRVCAFLAERFINESETGSLQRAKQTSDFIGNQVRAAEQTLKDIEERLKSFRVRNAGMLPDQLNSNVQQLTALQTQLSAVNEAISRIGQERMMLEAEIRTQRDQMTLLGSTSEPASVAMKNERLAQLERDIVKLETGFAALLQNYKETHPDVQSLKAQLAALRSQQQELIKEESAKAENEPRAERRMSVTDTRLAAAIEANIERLQAKIEAQNIELRERQRLQSNINENINRLQARISSVPVSEQEYNELTRDYAIAKANYQELMMKKGQSEMVQNLDARKQGETLALLNPPTVPITPARPKRILIIGIGAGLGLLIGLSLASAREMKDSSLKNLKDVRAYSRLPVLGSVPLLENDSVVRRRQRITWLGWTAAVMVGLVAMAGSMVYYYTQVRS